MLAPHEALGKARTYLAEVIPDFAALGPKVDAMKLSGEFNDKEKQKWVITFYAPIEDTDKVETLADIIRRQRIEKMVSLDAEDGHLLFVGTPDIPF
jgi:hypothetical protein